MRKTLLIFLAVLLTGVLGYAETIDLSFSTMGSTGWGNSYGSCPAYEPTGKDYTVTFSGFSKQTGTITTCPVARDADSYIIVALKNDKKFATVKFNFVKWGTRSNTVELEYSLDGTNFSAFTPAISGSTTANNNSISATTIPDGTIAIKMTSTKTGKNQFGVSSIEYTTAATSNLKDPELSFSHAEVPAVLGQPAPENPLTNLYGVEVEYKSSLPSVAEVDKNDGTLTLVGAGTTVISVTSTATDVYSVGTASYVLKVTDPNAKNPALLTKLDDLDGATGYIVCNTKPAIMGAFNDKYYNSVSDVEFNSDKTEITTIPDGALLLTFKKTDAGYSISYEKDGKTYYMSVSGTDMVESTTSVDASISITNNVLSIKFDNKSFLYNSVSPRFKVYTSNQTAVQIYILPSNDTRKDTELSFATQNFDIVYGDAFTAPDLQNPNNLSPITYTSSKPEVAKVDPATGAVEVVGAGTTVISANFDGDETYKKGSASYTLTVAEAAITLADFIAKGATAPESLEVVMNCDLTITYATIDNVYVTDGTTYGMIYKANVVENTTPGTVITKGWTGTIKIYAGLPEIIPNAATLATTAGTATVTYPEVESVSLADVNRVVILKNVTFDSATPERTGSDRASNFEGTVGGNTMAFRTNFVVPSVEAGTYDVKCVVNVFENGNTTSISTDASKLQIYPIEYIAVPEFVGDVVLAGMAITDDGIISGAISFTVNNYSGQTPEVTAVVLRADGTELTEQEGYAEVKLETPTIENGPARAAGTVAKYEGTVEGLILEPGEKGTNYKVKVNVKVGSAVAEATSLDTPTGVEGIVVDNEAPAVYYDLTGRIVENPASGLYIRVAGGKASKVYVR